MSWTDQICDQIRGQEKKRFSLKLHRFLWFLWMVLKKIIHNNSISIYLSVEIRSVYWGDILYLLALFGSGEPVLGAVLGPALTRLSLIDDSWSENKTHTTHKHETYYNLREISYKLKFTNFNPGCQWEVIKNVELHFVVNLCTWQMCNAPKGQERSPKGAEKEEHVPIECQNISP